jgi:hypothetical protein
MQIDGSVAMVTGSGIGAALAQSLPLPGQGYPFRRIARWWPWPPTL